MTTKIVTVMKLSKIMIVMTKTCLVGLMPDASDRLSGSDYQESTEKSLSLPSQMVPAGLEPFL